jgi:hypothetical protein
MIISTGTMVSNVYFPKKVRIGRFSGTEAPSLDPLDDHISAEDYRLYAYA